MKWIKGLMLLLGALYLLGLLVLYLKQEDILFLPDQLPEDHQFRSGREVEILVGDGISLNCLLMKEEPSRGVILYLHGNRGSNRRCWRQAQTLTGNGYDIFMPDYRGYGKSDGVMINEDQVFSDAQMIYDYLVQSYGEDQIYIVGYSIGSSMATYLAAHNHPQAMALVSPFYSVVDLKNKRLPIIPTPLIKFPFRNHKHLEVATCPVSIFHGTRDDLIPFDSSERLAALDPGRILLTPLYGEGHRGAIFNHQVREGVAEMLRR